MPVRATSSSNGPARFLGVLLALAGWMVASGAGSADEATAFFRTHHEEVEAQEREGRILFANRLLGLEFRKSPVGFQLARLYGVAEDQDFLTAPDGREPYAPLEIRVVLDPKYVAIDDRGSTREARIDALLDRMATVGKVSSVDLGSARTTSWRCEKEGDLSVLRLEWKGIDIANEKNVLDAEVAIALKPGDPFSRWRIVVRNRSARYGVERVRMPILPLAPIGESKDNVFIYPKWRGGYVEDPFAAPAGLGENYHTTGAYYPYYVNMQFWALYNRNDRRGIYLATQDPTPHMTHFLVRNTPESIEWSVSHFPPNIGFASEDFVLPYDVVARPFRGDWFDACQIYRDWALVQSWCRKGPLSVRRDIPKWYKEAPLFFYTMTCDSATGTHSTEENLRIAAEHFAEWLDWTSLRLPMNLYAWHNYEPGLTVSNMPFHHRRLVNAPGRWSGLPTTYEPSGNYPRIPALGELSSICRRLRDKGGMVCPYVCLQLFDQGPTDNAPYASEARPHMNRDLYGCIQTYPGLRMWLPCVASPWWQNRLVDTCVTLLDRENVGGFYLDVMHGMGIPCFWTPHGHSAGGGSAMTEGMHRIAGAIRDAVKARDPEAITTGEDATENMIDVVDGILYQRTLRPENRVPLFGTVYNDYVPRYGLELSVSRPDDFFVECTSLFVEGAQIGRLRLRPRDNVLLFQKPQHHGMFEFLGCIVGYYKLDLAKEFLVYGRLMRPLAFETPSPMPMLPYGSAETVPATDTGAALGRTAGMRYPALMSGVFRSRQTELGVFVVNASGSELNFRSALDPGRYEMPSETPLAIDSIAPDGSSRPVYTGARGTVLLEGTLPSHHIVMFRLRPVYGR